jgi:hypothetical protein
MRSPADAAAGGLALALVAATTSSAWAVWVGREALALALGLAALATLLALWLLVFGVGTGSLE